MQSTLSEWSKNMQFICIAQFSMKYTDDVFCMKMLYRFGTGNASTPISLAGVKCAKSSGQHLLRCKHSEEVMTSSGYTGGCDHSLDVAVFCSKNLC